jgi:hypothetical protein
VHLAGCCRAFACLLALWLLAWPVDLLADAVDCGGWLGKAFQKSSSCFRLSSVILTATFVRCF